MFSGNASILQNVATRTLDQLLALVQFANVKTEFTRKTIE